MARETRSRRVDVMVNVFLLSLLFATSFEKKKYGVDVKEKEVEEGRKFYQIDLI